MSTDKQILRLAGRQKDMVAARATCSECQISSSKIKGVTHRTYCPLFILWLVQYNPVILLQSATSGYKFQMNPHRQSLFRVISASCTALQNGFCAVNEYIFFLFLLAHNVDCLYRSTLIFFSIMTSDIWPKIRIYYGHTHFSFSSFCKADETTSDWRCNISEITSCYIKKEDLV